MKNEKTVIFGALIVAMILPLSSMGMADAQPVTEPFTPTDNWLITLRGQLDAIS